MPQWKQHNKFIFTEHFWDTKYKNDLYLLALLCCYNKKPLNIGALVIQGVKGSVEEDRIRTHLSQQDWFRAEFQHSTRRDGSRFQPAQYAGGNEI